MSGFDPGPGWVEVDPESTGRRELHLTDPETGRVVRSWARVEPVPPLPTEPYTVIRVTWLTGPQDYCVVLHDDSWWFIGTDDHLTPETLVDRITSFEVLAEPRAVTAKAVLDRIQQIQGRSPIMAPVYDVVAREFGAEA